MIGASNTQDAERLRCLLAGHVDNPSLVDAGSEAMIT
jgi:hypothetical protein